MGSIEARRGPSSAWTPRLIYLIEKDPVYLPMCAPSSKPRIGASFFLRLAAFQ
jgi:hypothetical protein